MSAALLPSPLHALSLKPSGLQIISQQGEVFDSFKAANASLFLVCHLPYLRSKIRTLPQASFLDVLELYAFVHPTQFCAPSPLGLAQALGLNAVSPTLLFDVAADLLNTKLPEPALALAANMPHWGWSQWILQNSGQQIAREVDAPLRPFSVWRDLPELSQVTTRPANSDAPQGLSGDEARQTLADLLTRQSGVGRTRTHREAQANYTTRVAGAFAGGDAAVVLAEAGTGVGKTLGYLAPSYAWAEKNQSQVWLSTYTKNLQRQIEREFETLYPQKDERERKAVIRKGRENYLCLLNFQEYVGQAVLGLDPKGQVTAGLMARFVAETADGDLTGGGFHGWLPGLLGIDISTLADRRGECIFAGCDHYDRCFVERAKRRAVRANIVVSNHAVLMIEAASASPQAALSSHFVLDEGHHIFDAADEAFGTSLTLASLAELRRWVIGPEGGLARKRGRSLQKRLEDVLAGDDTAQGYLRLVLKHAGVLPSYSALQRMEAGAPLNAVEKIFVQFLALLQSHVEEQFYSVELAPEFWPASLKDSFDVLIEALQHLHKPMAQLAARLHEMANECAVEDPMRSDRLYNLAETVHRRATHELGAWLQLLHDYAGIHEKPAHFIDWMELTRVDGKPQDIGIQRRFVDPMQPFAESLKPYAKGVVVTSATLRDAANKTDEESWNYAESRTGLSQLSDVAADRFSIASPYNYSAQAKVFVVTDIPKNTPAKLVEAYLNLFKAAEGGALGLFTSIARLKQVAHGLRDHLPYQLYAQHVDDVQVGTLIDMFRADEHSCLLGTDAVRDGVDVPGSSLRLLVMDRVPWARPAYVHRVRKSLSRNAADYDRRIARLKLKQAFGRLIRSETDKGVFVLLDNSLPSALETAFPEGVKVQRLKLADVVAEVERFL